MENLIRHMLMFVPSMRYTAQQVNVDNEFTDDHEFMNLLMIMNL